MHPRLTIHDRVFANEEPLAGMIAGFRGGGAQRVGVSRSRFAPESWEAAAAAVGDAGLDVTHIVHGPLFELEDPSSWESAAARAIETVDVAAALGARCVYGLTGPAYSLAWEDAAAAFVEAARPLAEHARARGLPFLIEPANMLFADLGFIHTLRDTVDLAREAGLGVCLDVQHCWAERGLRDTIRRATGLIGLVQLSDYLPGRRVPFRAVPGDGAIPLERIVAAVLDDGYAGLFDLELYEERGVAAADTIRRAAGVAGTMLERLGA